MFVSGQNICLNGALCSSPLNLICNMTTFRKKKCFDRLGVEGVFVCLVDLIRYVPSTFLQL